MLFLGSARATTPDLASALVQDTTTRMLKALEARRAELDANPGLIYTLVNRIVVPNFDFQRITRYAMGRYWRQADPDQRSAVVSQFQHLLVRTYAKALLNYAGQKIKVLPLRPGPREGEVMVRTEVAARGGSPVPIDYEMYLQDGAWKVYDVRIDGISLVANYRSSFAVEIRRGGIDGLINALKARNQGGAA
jgi:phospholipid transport system substrate-binding protein